MNENDFEQRLQRQPLRPIPTDWRTEILAAARINPTSSIPNPVTANSASAWRFIFARFPVAWGTLAVVWLALIGINVCLFGVTGPASPGQAIVSTAEPFSVWRLQATALRQLASSDENSSTGMPAPIGFPTITPQRPRSERRSAEGFGDLNETDTNLLVA